MAFLKFSRDKRGYEHFYLVQPTTRRGNKSRPRVLYWFRTPPNVKVGRKPFDADVRRSLEARNPDISFDWDTIVNTPVPPLDAEPWRERRRIQREMRRSSISESSAELESQAAEEPAVSDRTPGLEGASPAIDEMPAGEPDIGSTPPAGGADVQGVQTDDGAATSSPSGPLVAALPSGRRRRRRRGRRGRGRAGAPAPVPGTPTAENQGTIQEVEAADSTPASGDESEFDDPTGEV